MRAALVDDPAHYRWSSYPANALGQRDPLITPHPLYLDAEAIGDIRLARSQSQPLGNARFLDTIERVIGHRREAKPRDRPRVERTKGEGPDGQVQIELK